MTHIDLTVLRPVRLMVSRMSDDTPPPESTSPASPLDPFTVDEIARIVALSRFSRRAAKLKLHDKGVPNNSPAVDAFLAAVPQHRYYKRILELANQIESAKRSATRAPDQST